MADERQVKAFVLADPNISFTGTTEQEIADNNQQVLDYINEKSETRWPRRSS